MEVSSPLQNHRYPISSKTQCRLIRNFKPLEPHRWTMKSEESSGKLSRISRSSRPKSTFNYSKSKSFIRKRSKKAIISSSISSAWPKKYSSAPSITWNQKLINSQLAFSRSHRGPPLRVSLVKQTKSLRKWPKNKLAKCWDKKGRIWIPVLSRKSCIRHSCSNNKRRLPAYYLNCPMAQTMLISTLMLILACLMLTRLSREVLG